MTLFLLMTTLQKSYLVNLPPIEDLGEFVNLDEMQAEAHSGVCGKGHFPAFFLFWTTAAPTKKKDSWVTQEMYEEEGAQSLHKRCFNCVF
eukprot:NODE_5135_length_599_cov_32.532727_g4439_i0.p3 GENE.NODE_5135_length_599_cov_32.532727_g4439_i0~~NODE_5135_length_599_cov_32.532727_g4439_i0.p3  ORF type:complete len:90 (-),score=17.09 NODE_5135_length_599_cov_32.532727_g4439_i0:118-387(-)